MVGEAELSSFLSDAPPDVVLLDARMLTAGKYFPETDFGTTKIIAFAVSEAEADILACARSGVTSVVGCDSSAQDILSAIEGAMRGELACSSRMAEILFRQLGTFARSQVTWQRGGLTRRELEVINLIDQGCSNKEIASELGIGVLTVKNHVHNILDKLNVHRRGRAMAALRGAVEAHEAGNNPMFRLQSANLD
jgi:DNA-binding NarL/FixJ family response regulator